MTAQPFHMTAPAPAYRKRRARLAAAIPRPLVIFAGQPRPKQHATNTHVFRAGSSYLYFGGPPVAGAAILIEPGSDGDAGCALVREVLGVEDAVWTGEAPPDEALSGASGIDAAALIEPDDLKAKLNGRPTGYVAPPCIPTHQWIASLRLLPTTDEEMLAIIGLRLVQDEHELAAMRRVARVGAAAHVAAMKATAPGRRVADVAAAFVSVVVANECATSFSPIVTTHGEVLHVEGFHGVLEPGRLLLVDAGAEEPGGYASDMTRTYPVSGEFSTMQRQLCDTVLRAERACIEACVPGRRYRDVHDLAGRVICEGLVEAGLLKGDIDDLAGRAAHTLFMTHGVGHLIGLDVHDMEDFGDLAGYAPGRTRRGEFGNKYLRLDRDLVPGMSVTIEPGIYFVPALWQQADFVAPFADVVNRPAVEKLLEQNFGGIRIEDTITISQSGGPEILSADLPFDLDEIAGLVKG